MNDAKDRQMNVCLHLNYLYFRQVLIKTGRGWQNWRKTPNIKFDDHMFCGTWTVVYGHSEVSKCIFATSCHNVPPRAERHTPVPNMHIHKCAHCCMMWEKW